VINSSGRASELTDDCPVYHALSVHLSGGKLITRFDDRYAVANFSNSRVWSKSSSRKYSYFLKIPEFPYNKVWDKSREAPMPKTSQIRSAVSIEHRLATD